AGGVRHRPFLSPPGHAAVDQLRVAGEADVGAEAETLHDTGAEALDQAVGALDQVEDDGDAVLALQVDADAAPAAIQQVRRGPLRTADALGAVDAQHLRAHVRQHHRAERTGADARDLDDPNAFEWTHVRSLLRRAAR